jgi:predicted metalloprotease with PDZ domain
MFIYHFPKEFGRGGMEHAYSTAIELSAARLNQEALALAGVTAHEFFHLWNVKRIRPQSLEPIDYTKENYTRSLWFSEGLTNTVGEYMLVRAGLADESTFRNRLAGQIKTLETRPANATQSAEESSLDAWLEKYPYYRAPDRSVSYYDKGQIIGVLLDLEMRRVTNGQKSLRDLFQWMNTHYAKQGKFFPDTEGIRAALETVTDAKFEDFFRHYVGNPDPIPYNDFFQTVGLELERKQSTSADPGFTAASNFSATPIIISVTPGGEAEKANLRPGEAILAVNGAEPAGDVVAQIAAMEPGSNVKLKLSSRRGMREVKYKLAAKQDFDFQISDLPNPTAEQQARRAAWIRGDDEAAH